jgi:colanic acid/amylovoran biosynthesis glycosyltransferase
MNHIAYLVNQYPAVSHSFIRREIRALESRGLAVQRIALRGWQGELADAEDREERRRTRYVLKGGPLALLAAVARAAAASPRRFVRALILALRMSRRAQRPMPYHLAYLAEACRILPWLREAGATHVHAHFGTNAAEVAMLAHALGGPGYSFTVHGPEEFDQPLALKLADKAQHAAFVVAVSSYGRAQLLRWIDPAQWDKVKVVHCGLDKSYFAPRPAPPPGTARFVCVGRICEQKGQLLLVEAVAKLAARGVALELVIAGDGEMRPQLEASIARHGLEGRVAITGWIGGEAVRDEILAARALVLPSFAEGLPVVLMEAMALRRAVISTYVAGIPELVRPGENGWLAPAGDLEALCGALEEAAACPVETLERMGNAAFQRAAARHSIDVAAGELARLFQAGMQASSETVPGMLSALAWAPDDQHVRHHRRR